MQLPVGVSFRHTHKDPALVDLMEEECRKLEKITDNIISCRVALEKGQKFGAPAGVYRIKAEITLPGRHRVVVKKEAKVDGTYPALANLIRSAFEKTGLTVGRLKERQAVKIKSVRRKLSEGGE